MSQNPWGGRGCADGCLPFRGRLAWCPRLRTLLLVPFLIYMSVPILVRLFPNLVLTKFVFLNFRECLGAVPSGRAPPRASAASGELGVGGAVPGTWVALGQHQDSTQPASLLPWAGRGAAEGAFPVGASCFASSNKSALINHVATHLGMQGVNRAKERRWDGVAECSAHLPPPGAGYSTSLDF